MFTIRPDALLLSLRAADAFAVLPPAEDRRAWDGIDSSAREALIGRAEQALRLALTPLRASGRLSGDAYRREALIRRERLKALALGACADGSDRMLDALTDLLYAVSEETSWSLRAVYPEIGEPCDLFCLETGATVQMVLSLCGDALDRRSPAIRKTAAEAISRQIVHPLSAAEGMGTVVIAEPDIPRACAALLTVLLLGERDGDLRWFCLRKVLRLLEQSLRDLQADGFFPVGLTERLASASVILDCFTLIDAASGGELSLYTEPLLIGQARAFLRLHIAGARFANPGGSTDQPPLSPDALFRLGERTGQSELCGLAAFLVRFQGVTAFALDQPSNPLLDAAFDALYREDLIRTAAREPRRMLMGIPSMRFAAARQGAYYVGFTGGSQGREDAGDLLLYLADAPILGGLDQGFSTPIVNGLHQKGCAFCASDLTKTEQAGYRILSMNLAASYPVSAGLLTWQRTFMLGSLDDSIRLVEAFDFDAPGFAVFRFATRDRPILSEGAARLGPVTLRFDQALIPRIEPMPVGYLLTLGMPQTTQSGHYTFGFQATS